MKRLPFDSHDWILDSKEKTVTLIAFDHSSAFKVLLEKAREQDTFKVLKGWRDELYPIRGHQQPRSDSCISVERSGTPLFGLNTYGVHMTAYVQTSDGMKIWVPRRSSNKQTYGGMLDNTVAGGLASGETVLECLIREAAEEASLPEALVRENAKACGTVSYFYIRDKNAGGEIGLMQPECQYVYDLEVGPDVTPKPNDDEVEAFYLWTVEEVQVALAEGKFKPNCALVLLDFFIRRGILNPENEHDYAEIVSRLHRRLPFPTS